MSTKPAKRRPAFQSANDHVPRGRPTRGSASGDPIDWITATTTSTQPQIGETNIPILINVGLELVISELINFQRPNGLRLSAARRPPPNDSDSPGTVCSGTAARVRCSRGLGGLDISMPHIDASDDIVEPYGAEKAAVVAVVSIVPEKKDGARWNCSGWHLVA